MIFKALALATVAVITAVAASAETLNDLLEEKVLEEYEYQLDDGSDIKINLSGIRDQEVIQISQFYLDKPSGQFLADVVMAQGSSKRIGGVAIIEVPVIVPTKQLVPGSIVSDDDLAIIKLPKGRVSAFALTTKEAIVGMEVKRMLNPGRSIARQSLTPPIVIRRGQKIDIEYSNGAMALTAPGRATSDAPLGAEIKVINLVSNNSVVGYAKHDGIVEVIR